MRRGWALVVLAAVLLCGCEKNPNWHEGVITKVEFHAAWHETGGVILIPQGNGQTMILPQPDEDHAAYTDVTVRDSLGYEHHIAISGAPNGMRPGQRMIR